MQAKTYNPNICPDCGVEAEKFVINGITVQNGFNNFQYRTVNGHPNVKVGLCDDCFAKIPLRFLMD